MTATDDRTAVTCPAWCVTCFTDVDGRIYHRGAEVALPGGGYVQALTTTAPWQPTEPAVFVVDSDLDDERNYDGTRAFAEAILAFVDSIVGASLGPR